MGTLPADRMLSGPPLVLGTMTFGDRVDRAGALAMVEAAREAGVTWFDTANLYTGGASERLLGEAIRGFRDEVVVATKVRHPVDASDPDGGLSRRAIPRALEASLRRLDLERVDLLYFHQPDWEVDLEESLEAAHALVDAGKVGALALSNYPAWLIAQAHAVCDRRGWERPRVHQLMYNPIARQPDGEYARFSERADLVNVVYNPLAGGLLTGRYPDVDELPTEGRFTMPMYRDRYWHPRVFEAVARLAALARDAGCSLVELAYRWLKSRELVGAIILGASSLDQLWENLDAAAGPPLDADLLARCDEVWQDLRGPVPHYWR